MALDCPDCRYPIPYDDINITKTIAKCKQCNNLFEFSVNEDGTNRPLLDGRKQITIPPGIEILTLMNELEIMIKWRKAGKFFAPFFAIFWNMFMLPFFLAGIFSGAYSMLLVLTPFIMVGMFLIYQSFGFLLNTTYITVDDQHIGIEHKPINFLLQRDTYYKPDEIDQLYTKRIEVGRANGRPIYAFSVYMILKNKKQVKLVDNLHADDYAHFIEQEIEHYLKIPNRKVAGEWKGMPEVEGQ